MKFSVDISDREFRAASRRLAEVPRQAEFAQRSALRAAAIKGRQIARRLIAAAHPPLIQRDLRKHVERYIHPNRVRIWVGLKVWVRTNLRAKKRRKKVPPRLRVPLDEGKVADALNTAGREAVQTRYPQVLRREVLRRYRKLVSAGQR